MVSLLYEIFKFQSFSTKNTRTNETNLAGMYLGWSFFKFMFPFFQKWPPELNMLSDSLNFEYLKNHMTDDTST